MNVQPPDDPDADAEAFPEDEIWEDEPNDSSAHEPVSTTCWRCEKPYGVELPQCPACLAVNRSASSAKASGHSITHGPQSPAIVRVVWVFVAMAVASIALAFCIAFSVDPTEIQQGSSGLLLGWIAVFEFIYTLIVLYALGSIQTAPIPAPSTTERRIAWIVAIPMLVGVLGINLVYHNCVRDLLGVGIEANPLLSAAGFLPLQLILVCVQPAIVEELFFRRVAMGAALEMVSPRWAILITSLLFALAHLGQPLSLPVLGLLGIVLGYLRLTSGTLWLPMLFHFVHNLVVLLVELWR